MANTGNTQQQIDYGASANDGTGDPLRTAFIKTDENFDNIWLAGPVGSNVTITNNTIQANNTNGNLILSPNGVGVIQTNSRLLPRLNNTYDLGSTTLKYRTGYFGTGGLVIDGNVTVAGNLTAGNISYTGNVFVGDLQGSVYADDSTIMVDAVDNELFASRATISGNVSGTYFIGNGSQLTGIASSYGNSNVAAYLPTYTGALSGSSLGLSSSGSLWSINTDTLTFPSGATWRSDKGLNDEFISSNVDGYLNFQTFDNTSNLASELHMEHGLVHINVYNGSLKQWEFNEDGTAHFPGDLLPQANLGGNLGSSESQWNDLWVSNNTIYINSVPVTLSTGNVLTVNGNAVLTNNSNTTVSTTGNITASYFFGNGSQLTGLPAPTVTQDITSNGAMSLMTYDGVIKYVSYATVEPASGNLTAGNISSTGNISGNYFIGNGSQLTGISTANTGNVTFSGEAVIGTGTSNTISGLYLAPDPVSLANDLYLRVRGNIQDEPTHIHFDTGNNQYYNQFIGDDYKYIQLANTGNIVINTSDYVGNTAQWTFDNFGTLALPGGSRLRPLGANLDIFAGTGSYVNLITSDESSYMGVGGAGGYVVTAGGTWDFNTNGNLTAPGNVSAVGNITGGNIVTSGSGGDITMSAGNITGANVVSANTVSATGNITGAYLFGNGSQLTGITASVPSQTILPTIQTITVEARPAGLFGGGQGGANVTVANTIPVTEYGVIITDGTTSEKYKTGSLGSIPGTVSLTFTTGLNSAQFTVFAYVTSNAGTYYSNSSIGTSGICLLAGTQIALSDGTRKAIEHITYTDKLLSWDFDRGCYAETTAVWIKCSETGSQYNLLTFSDGTTLRTFDQHRIFNKQAGAFTYPMTDATPVGTVTVNEHGQEITLTNKQVIVDTIEYYNVITDHHMNLFSDTVLTSCRFNNIYPITDMKFVKDGRTLRTRAEFENIPDRFFYGLRLAEQTTDIETVEWYVNRLLRTEVSTESELTV